MKSQTINRVLFIKIIFTAFLLLFIAACSDKHGVGYEKLLGLYQITDRVCDVPDSYKSDCEQAKFIELVKGQFYGVSDNEVAFVIWRGDKGEELLYQARKINMDKYKVPTEGELIIASDESEKEYLTIHDRNIVTYHLAAKTANNANKVYRYTLRSVNRSSISGYQMVYPGNE